MLFEGMNGFAWLQLLYFEYSCKLFPLPQSSNWLLLYINLFELLYILLANFKILYLALMTVDRYQFNTYVLSSSYDKQ